MSVIVVWFSCGAASAVAAALTLQQYGETDEVRILNNPVAEEDEDNQRFQRDVEQWLGVKIQTVTNSKYPSCSAVDVWEKRQYMSGVSGAPCTLELKKMARQQYEMDNDIDWHVLGFTSDEVGRFCNFQENERLNTLPVLIEHGMSKADCYRFLQDAGIEPPRIYKEGYPNANCIGCVKATSPTYWNHVRNTRPEVFAQRAEQSRRIGVKLSRCHPKYLPWCEKDSSGFWWDRRKGEALSYVDAKGKLKLKTPRLFLDELPPGAKGRPMKNLDFECGIFCNTGEAMGK